MNIGFAIKKLRKESAPDLTQYQYAERIGITQAYLSQIEKGRKRPSMEVIECVAKDFEIPLAILFWFGVEDSDIRSEKREYFRFLKPSIDTLIESIV